MNHHHGWDRIESTNWYMFSDYHHEWDRILIESLKHRCTNDHDDNDHDGDIYDDYISIENTWLTRRSHGCWEYATITASNHHQWHMSYYWYIFATHTITISKSKDGCGTIMLAMLADDHCC